MKVIGVIGFSGSGKTYLIETALRKLKFELNLEVGVIKYIHEHPVDEEGKDSSIYSKSGATFSIIKNKFNESAIFLTREINLHDLILWLNDSPFKLDLIFFESFRNLPYPTILCVENLSQIGEQLNKNVKMISGLIATRKFIRTEELKLPIVDIEKNFKEFCKIFELIEEK
jgi:molybdopterin-guanine dinucleotide biosynthesis protein MobB